MDDYLTYVFLSPFSYQSTVEIITRAVSRIGKIKTADLARGYIFCNWTFKSQKRKVEFFIERGVNSCKVRARIKAGILSIPIEGNPLRAQNLDDFYDYFLCSLFNECPDTNFGVSLANRNAYITDVLFLGGETEQVHSLKTSNRVSLSGFLIGDFLFGAPGAIVGGLSGSQHTYGTTKTGFSNTILVRVVLNNGRLNSGSIKTNSRVYNEIMVNMK